MPPMPQCQAISGSAAEADLAASSPFDVCRLRVLLPAQNGSFRRLCPGDDEFDCVASLASLALDLLECKSSILALKAITRDVAKVSLEVPGLRNLEEKDIEPIILEYLGAIRTSFPHVVVSNQHGMEGKNGRTHKKDCQDTFEPKSAAVIELNATLVKWLADALTNMRSKGSAKSTRRFRTLHLRLSITLAHELVHIFVLFLVRIGSEHTPPQVSFGPFGTRTVGESGRSWESKLFGGYIDMRHNTEGIEAIAFCDETKQNCWRIKTVVIDDLLGRHFNRWLQPGVPLSDKEEYPKGQATERLTGLQWKVKYDDVFPPLPPTAQGSQKPGQEAQELSPAQIAELTAGKIMDMPQYNMSGHDLRAFALDPVHTRLRQVMKG
ncbi:2791e6ce-f16d-4b4f-a668-ba9c8bef67c5 [Thermothielavioides terrestris]|uniref:2791e6ce-f16d-4b4f-a668-ba9c8bef67c5 n=1 Tax=Thermothielavioides terrestris TaxID=2587410 RepID=A0A446BSY5_9PEZI|nr:2791e6ce-f16d-4b4f-a668-ba9c8bef67c5 [Thermothielavioides terrestris]